MRGFSVVLSIPNRDPAKRRNSGAVIQAGKPGTSGRYPICCRMAFAALVASWPRIWTEPDVGRASPRIMRSVVVLPAPLGPKKLTI